eukprot:TRINITY_DN6816_c0_g1_i1.p1 TRINITY_DN6816_c0_g1~~TRINITY_DN6816_c0_g1_i1.p1  ORF type:complete len:525 (-),score=97.59 TRINITY_DN6816_c0_g1_i1:283-1749(-)
MERAHELQFLADRSFKEMLSIAEDNPETSEASESFQRSNPNWEVVTEKYGVTIYKKAHEEGNFMKGVGLIENSSPKTVFDVVNDVGRSKEWDRTIVEARIVKKINEQMHIVYVSTMGQFPVAPRDFCLLVVNRVMPDGTYIQLTRSIEDHDVPPVSGKVRAELHTSGFVIKPKISPYSSNVSSLVTYIVQFDPKGWIPTFITNKVAEYQPLRISKIRNIVMQMNEKRLLAQPSAGHFASSQIEGRNAFSGDTSTIGALSPIPYQNASTSGYSPAKYSPFKSPAWKPNFEAPEVYPKKVLDFGKDEDTDTEEKEDAKFADPINDFSNVSDDVGVCVSTLQDEVAGLQIAVQRAQGQLNLLETSLIESSRELGLEMPALPSGSGISSLHPLLMKLVLHLKEQQVSFKRKEEEIFSRMDQLSSELFMTERLKRRRTSWLHRVFVTIFFVLVWPLISYYVWSILRHGRAPRIAFPTSLKSLLVAFLRKNIGQ